MSETIEFGVELGLTPIKSTMRMQPDALVFDDNGMFGDRELMFVEAEGKHVGQFISLRADGVMALVESVITDDRALLDHPDAGLEIVPRLIETDENRIDVSVHKWHGVGVDQGNQAAEWGRAVFGRAVRLVRVSEEKPRFVEDNQRLGRVGFSDGYPLLVVS